MLLVQEAWRGPQESATFPSTLVVPMQEAHGAHFGKHLFAAPVYFPPVLGTPPTGRFITLWVTGMRCTQTFLECHQWCFHGGPSQNENMHTSLVTLPPDFMKTWACLS